MWLISDGDKAFSDPITKHIPELREYAAQSSNPVTANFDEITIGDLAGQMGGIARDCTLY